MTLPIHPSRRPSAPAEWRRTAAAAAAMLTLFAAAGCATVPGPAADAQPPGESAPSQTPVAALAVPADAGDTAASVSSAPTAPRDDAPAVAARPGERLLRGNDRVVAPNRAAAVSGANTALRFEAAPLPDVVHAILRELLQVNYVVHPPLNGTVTLSTGQPVSAERALVLLEAALQANGYQMVRDPAGTYHVGKAEQLRAVVPGVAVRDPGTAAPLPAGQGVLVVPLRYIGAAEMAAILRPFMPDGALARVDGLRNLLVFQGTRSQIDGWLDLVQTFDVDLLRGMSVGVFPLQHVSARDVEAALRLLAAPGGGAAARASAPVATGQGGAAAPNTATPAAETALSNAPFPLLGAVRVLPLERANAVVVVSPRAEYLDLAREWIAKLDVPGLGGSDNQLFVYRVQNGNARHLADVLAGLFGAGPATPQPSSGVAPGATPTTATSATSGGNFASLPAAAGQSAQPAASPAVTLSGGLRVMADQYNNAILVWGSAGQYRQIEQALKRLDAAPTQVLIEASIIEVQLVDDLQYGIQWYFTDRHGSNSGSGVLSALANLGNASGAFTYTLRGADGNIRAVLNALAEKSLIKVISSPSLMVLDNHTASIVVGNQQPVRTSETVTTGGNVTTSITYKDTGVSLTVTPSVNAGDIVSLQLQQAVTDVGAIDTATGQRAFLQRQIGSRVAVRSGETLVLGGLIRDNSTAGNAGLPIAKDIPLFGWLFGAQNRSANRTELLVLITPRVLRSADDSAAIAQELRQRMQTLLGSGLHSTLPPPGVTTPPAAQSQPAIRP
ncbi:type II secretion system secretin GspD [Tepidimonas taiwanensis]|uniref:Type II secretion system protein D n=1 Tax=Tepidimonas taiwanensis TaxID=307486 RepID=A0A554XE54_9BURK|nr:type II secretion system secretin GspD [Tepidimonas taiwanensis]TSE34069.1 Type II secretion system protein D [Tepidimonas taiwanensis]UBQ04955.1 type II secretion system secretin GspD [Tepidimonas taiwanensis]